MDSSPAHFPNAAAFRAWLRTHHRTATHLVVRIARNHAAHQGVTYAQALEEALCFGWIDGVRRSLDRDSFSIRFSPRKPRSIWSRVNVRHAKRLVAAGRMTGAGLKAFEARDEARTGVYSFERQPATLAPMYQALFRKKKKAWKYFQEEAPWYRRTSIHWVMSARREETREKRLATLMACSAKGERIPPLQRTPKGGS